MEKVKSYRDLIVWQRSIQFTNRIYELTSDFPDYEKFGLANQLRRAAVSVPSNLAEGSVRSKKGFARFIMISRGSVAEIETQLLIAKNEAPHYGATLL